MSLKLAYMTVVHAPKPGSADDSQLDFNCHHMIMLSNPATDVQKGYLLVYNEVEGMVYKHPSTDNILTNIDIFFRKHFYFMEYKQIFSDSSDKVVINEEDKITLLINLSSSIATNSDYSFIIADNYLIRSLELIPADSMRSSFNKLYEKVVEL